MEKKTYEALEMEVIAFREEDVITASELVLADNQPK